MSRAKFNTLNLQQSRIGEMIDDAIRNAEICTMWYALKLHTELTYRNRLSHIGKEYNLSPSRIEDIVRENESIE